MRILTGTWVLLEGTRRAGWFALFLAIALYSVVLPVWNLPRFGPLGEVVNDLEQATNGWIGPQLVYPWMTLGLVSLAIFGVGRLHAEDVGWRAKAVVLAVAITILFWMSSQAILMIVLSCTGHELRWSPWWWGKQSSVLGSLLDQVLGITLAEETYFRGLLLPQLYLHAARALRKWQSLVVALLGSTILFVLSHVPRHISEGLAGEAMANELFWGFRFGLILTLVFLFTKNLFLCIGLHSLWNARPTLIDAPWETVDGIWWVLTTALIIGSCLVRLYRGRKPGASS